MQETADSNQPPKPNATTVSYVQWLRERAESDKADARGTVSSGVAASNLHNAAIGAELARIVSELEQLPALMSFVRDRRPQIASDDELIALHRIAALLAAGWSAGDGESR